MSKRLTTDEFIEKAKKVHGEKYEYDKVEYIDAQTKVDIFCKNHNDYFKQKAYLHLSGRGCMICNGKTRSTTEEFINKARMIHKDKYDYSNVTYIDRKTKVEIICPTHGSFFQQPASHLEGRGCEKCGYEMIGAKNKSNTEEFIKKATLTHGDRYDYSKSNYTANHSEIEIICKTHGSFWQSAISHIRGSGCFKCTSLYKDTEKFIRQAIAIHGDKYDYSKTHYDCANSNLIITCPIHGDVEMSPRNHLESGCKICSQSKVNDSNRLSIVRPELVKYFKNKDNANNYAEFSMKKDSFICPDCGTEKEMRIVDLSTRGFSCKSCSDSIPIGEKFIFNLLKFLNLEFICQYNTQWSENKRYDFYIPSLNLVIEASGSQHFVKVNNDFMGTLEDIQANDRYKENLAKLNGIENYVHVDCSVYDFEFLKKSSLHSLSVLIPSLKTINLQDWLSIWEKSVKSKIILAVDLWNSGVKDLKVISKGLGLHSATISRYLVIGTKLGLCNYDTENYRGKYKKFYQYDLNLNLIAEYYYVKHAVNNTGISKSTIVNSLCGYTSTGAGFYWVYEGENVKDRINPKKSIYKYDSNLKLIAIFHSVKEASDSINSSESYVSSNLNGKTKTCKGFIFSYVPLHEVNENI